MAKVALLVGVSEYEPGLNPLPGSVKDVDAMQRVLAHPEMGGFAEADITVLKNPQRQAMEDAIYSLFSGRKKDDLLLFYFSGHGIKDENGRLYLATRATRKDSNGSLVPPSAVAAASLHENINASRSQRQVMILDCCFSGAIAQGMTVKDDGTVNLKDYLGGKGRAILTSSTSTEYSFGSATPGHEDEGLSIYTRYLVEGIEKGAADTDGDGWIAVEELHEYAANRVKEAAPAMTPKFYPVEEGYKIKLARSRKDDPKLKYRKEAQTRAEQGQGQFSIIAQRLLGGKRIEWGISAEEAKAIEDEVLQPYREYELKQQEYEQALTEVVQAGYPLSATAEAELKEYQQQLGLRDSDIAAIEARILAPLRAQFTQQSAAYQQNLVQYEQALTDAIQQEFPLSQQTRQKLERLQQSLGLRDEDINRVEHSLIQRAELRHQEKLRQEAEQQQQQQEKAEYENKLRRYEQEFTKAIQSEYPLNQYVLNGLEQFQQQLGLEDNDIARIEQPIREPLEAKYQEKLRRTEHENKLQRYEQEFSKAIQAGYPLREYIRGTLENFQQILGLTQEEVSCIEKPLLSQKEIEYQQQAKQLFVQGVEMGTSSIVAIQLDASGISVSVLKDKNACVIPNRQGKLKTPAVIACTSTGKWLVGQEAKDQASTNSANTFGDILSLIGRHYDEISREALYLPYKIIKDEDGYFKINCPSLGQKLKPEEILAQGLRSIITDASQYLGWQIEQVFVSVPSCFTKLQRMAVKDAVRLANLECIRLTHSSTLAALAYGIDIKGSETVLVVDVSEGHIVTSILEVGDGVFEVLSVSGKCFLSSKEEQQQQQVLNYFRTSLENTLLDSKIAKDDIGKVFLTGCSSYIVAIEERVRQLTSKQPVTNPFSETAVVLGAAIYAGILCGLVKDVLPLDAICSSLGMETVNEKMHIMIPRNTSIPTKRSEVFTTVSDNQTSIEVQVVEGDLQHGQNIIHLGSFCLDGITPAPRGVPKLEICFDIDANESLSITATDKGNGKKLSVGYQDLDKSLKQKSTIQKIES